MTETVIAADYMLPLLQWHRQRLGIGEAAKPRLLSLLLWQN